MNKPKYEVPHFVGCACGSHGDQKMKAIEFTLSILNHGPRRIHVLKRMRELKEISLADAQKTGVFLERLYVSDATKLKYEFESLGATVELVATDWVLDIWPRY